MRRAFLLLFFFSLSLFNANADELSAVIENTANINNSNINDADSSTVIEYENKQENDNKVEPKNNTDTAQQVIEYVDNTDKNDNVVVNEKQVSDNKQITTVISNKDNSKILQDADRIVVLPYDKLLKPQKKNSNNYKPGMGFRIGSFLDLALNNLQFLKNTDSFLANGNAYADLVLNIHGFFNPFIGVAGGVFLDTNYSIESAGNKIAGIGIIGYNIGMRVGNNFFHIRDKKKVGTSMFLEFGKKYFTYDQLTEVSREEALRNRSYVSINNIFYVNDSQEKFDGYYVGGGIDFNIYYCSIGLFYQRTQISSNKMHTTLDNQTVNFNSMIMHTVGVRFGFFLSF